MSERGEVQVSIQMAGRVAIGLRYILPIVAESMRHAREPGGRKAETFEMLEEAVASIDASLPPEFRGAIDNHKIAEYRMDAIDIQREAGVRHDPASDPAPTQPSGGK